LSIYFYDNNLRGSQKDTTDTPSIKIPKGVYVLESLQEKINSLIKDVKVSLQYNTILYSNPSYLFYFGKKISQYLGVLNGWIPNKTIREINMSSSIHVYCDLLDKGRNILNGEPSDLMFLFHPVVGIYKSPVKSIKSPVKEFRVWTEPLDITNIYDVVYEFRFT